MPHQVRNTDHGIVADGYDLDAAGARELARKLIEAADALDPFPAGPDPISTSDDPPKCPDCKGAGKIQLFSGVVDCETCDGSGY